MDYRVRIPLLRRCRFPSFWAWVHVADSGASAFCGPAGQRQVLNSVTVTARCAGADNLVMRELLLVNRPMLLFHDRSRCEIPDCDIPAVECVTNVGRVQNSRTRHVRTTTRDWDLDLLPITIAKTTNPSWCFDIGAGRSRGVDVD